MITTRLPIVIFTLLVLAACSDLEEKNEVTKDSQNTIDFQHVIDFRTSCEKGQKGFDNYTFKTMSLTHIVDEYAIFQKSKARIAIPLSQLTTEPVKNADLERTVGRYIGKTKDQKFKQLDGFTVEIPVYHIVSQHEVMKLPKSKMRCLWQ